VKKDKLKVGIVGGGGIAQIIHLPTLAKMPQVEVCAVCDVDIRKASILAKKYSIKNVYSDIIEMFTHHELDLVFILTPTNLHLPMSLVALEHGANLFIEKPLARNSEEAARIAEAATKNDRTVMVGMQHRFRSDVQTTKSFMEVNELGTVFYAKASWRQAKYETLKQPWLFKKQVSGGGVVLDLGILVIDLIWWLKGKPKLISAKALEHKFDKKLQVEDFCSFILSFANDFTMTCEVSWNFPLAKDQMHIELVGADGVYFMNPLKINKLWKNQVLNITPESKESTHSMFRKSYETEIIHLIDHLTGKAAKLESKIDDAVQILKITDAIYQSIENGEEVYLTK